VTPFFKTEPPKTIEVAMGDSVLLYCDISGRPKPDITWTYSNLTKVELVQRRSSRFSFFSNGTLLIKNVEESDYGIYFCHVTNMFNTNRKIELVQVSTDSDTSEKEKIGK